MSAAPRPVTAAAEPTFAFVQFELPFALGPADGRYLARGHAGEIEHVVVLATLGAPTRAGFLKRRRDTTAAPQPPPEPVTTGRATIVHAAPLDAPDGWLGSVDREAEARTGVVALNRVLHAHRIASADPTVREISREQAIVVRLGVGPGERVADGRWSEAIVLPPPPPVRRSAALRPQERLAALLGGHDVALACEDLVLRARADLDAGRLREAALQADVALRAALAELEPWRTQGDLDRRLLELAVLAPEIAEAAETALQGGLETGQAEAVGQGIDRLEAALRARTAPGF